MAKAIFTGKKEKELSLKQGLTSKAFFPAIFMYFRENLLMRNCPCNTSNRYW
jgi:hypothetical protein